MENTKKASDRDAFFLQRTGRAGAAYVRYAGHVGVLAVFVLLGSLWLTPLSAAPCSLPDTGFESAEVGFVFDGDTIQLRDGRHVRLLGINTPEEGRRGRPDEPHADAATRALKAVLGKRAKVRLYPGKARTDRYGRLLAHLFLEDGRNVQAWMLEQGHAMMIAVPPNLRLLDCYGQAERTARRAQRGLWTIPAYQPVAATTLTAESTGFHRVQGEIVRVGESKKSIWLNFAPDDADVKAALYRGTALRIARSDLGYFAGLDLKGLAGRQVRARGWVHSYRGQPVIRIRHASMMEVLEHRRLP